MLSNEHASHKNVSLKTLNKILMRYLSDSVLLHSASPPVNLTGRINGGNFVKKIRTENSKRWSLVVLTECTVGLTGFSDRRISGLLLGSYKSSRHKGVVVLTG